MLKIYFYTYISFNLTIFSRCSFLFIMKTAFSLNLGTISSKKYFSQLVLDGSKIHHFCQNEINEMSVALSSNSRIYHSLLEQSRNPCVPLLDTSDFVHFFCLKKVKKIPNLQFPLSAVIHSNKTELGTSTNQYNS